MREGTIHPGPLERQYLKTLETAERGRVRARLWQRDHTLWKPSPDEIADRLGWLDCPRSMTPLLPDVEAFAESVRAEGFRQVLLLGMGGSSLAPELYARLLGTERGLPLEILDTTDPVTILDFTDRFPPEETLYLVSTKSGGTVETLSLLRYFYRLAVRRLGTARAGGHFTAITDPGSGLAALAEAFRFRKIFLNDPDIGGRFSALSLFGLVPAALAGASPRRLLEDAAGVMARERHETRRGTTGGLELGLFLGEAARAGRDKLTFFHPAGLSPLADWLEQLLAESTGKEGKGILPVPGGDPVEMPEPGEDRVFAFLLPGTPGTPRDWVRWAERGGCPWIAVDVDPRRDLGGFLYLWEIATAYACWRLEVNPFDQPDVESAKEEARLFLRNRRPGAKPPGNGAAGTGPGSPGATRTARALREFLSGTAPGGYVAVQAFLPYDPDIRSALERLRMAAARLSRRSATAGFGPRYLHSTGQLHKGDGGRGRFVQITAEDREDVAIPETMASDESTLSFGVLKAAQAAGDRSALERSGREVFHLHLDDDPAERLRALANVLRD
jgi:glucose-6-phosphate isomerase